MSTSVLLNKLLQGNINCVGNETYIQQTVMVIMSIYRVFLVLNRGEQTLFSLKVTCRWRGFIMLSGVRRGQAVQALCRTNRIGIIRVTCQSERVLDLK